MPEMNFEESGGPNEEMSPAAMGDLISRTDSKQMDMIQETKMRMLQSEVTKLKDILARLLEDITISLPVDLRTEMQTSVDMPQILSPGRNYL